MPGKARSMGSICGGGRQRPCQLDRLVESPPTRGKSLLLGGHVCRRQCVAVDDSARELILPSPLPYFTTIDPLAGRSSPTGPSIDARVVKVCAMYCGFGADFENWRTLNGPTLGTKSCRWGNDGD